MDSLEVFLEKFITPYREAGLTEDQINNVKQVFTIGYMTGVHFAMENLLLKNTIDPTYRPRMSPN